MKPRRLPRRDAPQALTPGLSARLEPDGRILNPSGRAGRRAKPERRTEAATVCPTIFHRFAEAPVIALAGLGAQMPAIINIYTLFIPS